MKRFIIVLVLALAAASLMAAPDASQNTQGEESSLPLAMWRYIGAALAVGMGCIAGGIAMGQIGSAAMGAMSENPDLAGKALPYAGLAEGICLWGFLVALLILVV